MVVLLALLVQFNYLIQVCNPAAYGVVAGRPRLESWSKGPPNAGSAAGESPEYGVPVGGYYVGLIDQ